MNSFCESSDSFVLRVATDHLEPELPKDSIIVVDPTRSIRNDDFVVTRVSNKIELGQIAKTEDKWMLNTSKHTNQEWIRVESTDFIGRVVKCFDSKRNLIRNFS